MNEQRPSLSLVPYSSDSRQIVLRHRGHIVVLDDHKHLSVRSDPDSTAVEIVGKCPTCQRPFSTEPQHGEGPLSPSFDNSYINPEYFHLLQRSRPPSDTSSRPPSPDDHLLQSADSGTSTPSRQAARHAAIEDEDEAPGRPHRISRSALLQGHFKRFFREERVLGRGGKGVVMLVMHVLDGVEMGLFACKQVAVGDDHAWLKKVLREVQLLQRLHHRNLVEYNHVWLEEYQFAKFGPPVPCAFILQQYCNGGDLHHYVLGRRATLTTEDLKDRVRTRSKGSLDTPTGLFPARRMPFEEILSFFTDITAGLNYLHRENLIHRDLKPSNCLLHTTAHQTRVLVSDFGEVQGEGAIRKSTGNTGTISYCAPEVLRRDETHGNFGNFSFKSDIFSLGMIVHFMCFGRLPYSNADAVNEENEDLDELRAEISAWIGLDEGGRERRDLPDRLYSFLKRLLSLDPEERPSTDDILLMIQTQAATEEHNHQTAWTTSRAPDDAANRAARMAGPPSPSANATDTKRSMHSPTRPGTFMSRTNSSKAERTLSAPMQRSATEGSSSQGESSMILRKRVSSSGFKRQDQGLRLLPAPPTTRTRAALNLLQRPPLVIAGKLLIFVLKFWSIFGPCSPYAAYPHVAYPLLALGALELVGLTSGIVESGLLAMLHVAVVAVCLRYDMLCPSEFQWGYVPP